MTGVARAWVAKLRGVCAAGQSHLPAAVESPVALGHQCPQSSLTTALSTPDAVPLSPGPSEDSAAAPRATCRATLGRAARTQYMPRCCRPMLSAGAPALAAAAAATAAVPSVPARPGSWYAAQKRARAAPGAGPGWPAFGLPAGGPAGTSAHSTATLRRAAPPTNPAAGLGASSGEVGAGSACASSSASSGALSSSELPLRTCLPQLIW